MITLLDGAVIAAYLILSLVIGLWYRRSAASGLDHFFLGGRSLSWPLLGLSLVATTFAADTPLAVTELVYQNGVAGNWLWWNLVFGGLLTTFFFARLWRRSGVMTDVELVTLRYSGPAVPWLRGFKAIYQGVFLNAIIIGWVNLALMSLLQVFFQLDASSALAVTAAFMLLTAGYSALSGLMGVVVTDAVQFCLAMVGCIVLAIVVVNSPTIGGLSGLVAQVPPESLRFFPEIGQAGTSGQLALGLGTFLAYATVQWWASWYPGAEPGGGGYVAQRMLAARNERQSLAAVLFFQIMHYAVRPWPWILVGLSALVLYPHLPPETARLGYVYAMRDFLPSGLRGLLLVAFLAAYMSTISTQLNFGASYLVNDVIKPWLAGRSAANDARREVRYAQFATLALMVVALIVTSQLTSIAGAWRFLLECGAGTGLVLILRWYWWRVSAWSELAATFAPFLFYGLAVLLYGWFPASEWWRFPGSFFFTVGMTTVTWLAVTWLAPPTDDQTIGAFVARVRPQGWWGRYAVDTSDQAPLAVLAVCWLAGIALVLGMLFATGAALLLRPTEALGWSAQAMLSILIIAWLSRRYPIFR